MLGDWHQLWEIASAPDNVPIVALLFLVPFSFGTPSVRLAPMTS